MVKAICRALVVAVFIVGSSAGWAQEREATDAQPVNIDRNGVLVLVRSTLLALDHANRTGNYTVLRDLGAPSFQRNSAAVLAEIFASHRARQIDLGGVAVLEPQLTIMPRFENGLLRMAGLFPSVPAEVHFDLMFAPVDRQWRLYGIALDVSASGPMAPESEGEEEQRLSMEPPEPPIPPIDPRRVLPERDELSGPD